MTDSTPLTDFIDGFRRHLRSRGWSEDKIDTITMETWTDGKYIRTTINFRGVVADTRLPISGTPNITSGEAEAGSEANSERGDRTN